MSYFDNVSIKDTDGISIDPTTEQQQEIEVHQTLLSILRELKLMNLHLQTITDEKFSDNDIEELD